MQAEEEFTSIFGTRKSTFDNLTSGKSSVQVSGTLNLTDNSNRLFAPIPLNVCTLVKSHSKTEAFSSMNDKFQQGIAGGWGRSNQSESGSQL